MAGDSDQSKDSQYFELIYYQLLSQLFQQLIFLHKDLD